MNSIKNYDIVSCLLVLSLMIIGLVNIYSTTYFDEMNFFSLDNFFGKQLFFFSVCIFTFFLCMIPDIKIYFKYGSIIYLLMVFLLIGVLFFGNEVNGSRSWFSIAGFSFQPSEFMKPVTALALAKFLSNIHSDIKKLSIQFYSFLIISIPLILIVLQPDPGTALIFLGFYLVLHIVGLPSIYMNIFTASIFLFLLTILFGKTNMLIFFSGLFALFFVYKLYNALSKTRLVYYAISSIVFILCVDFIFNNIFEQRHRDRFNVILGLENDNQGIGYNINQSKIAIGSGGFSGKGFLNGTQTKGGFVPEQHTDYIFSTVGEEWGFLGSSGLIILFTILILRIIYRAEKHMLPFPRVFSYCFASMLFIHFFINVGMTLGLVPTVGIPLPFISYGGTNLMAFSLMLFIYLNLDANRLH